MTFFNRIKSSCIACLWLAVSASTGPIAAVGDAGASSAYVTGPTEYDIGEVSKGTVVRKVFRLVNTHDEPLVFSITSKTCGCLKAEILGAAPVLPGRTSAAVLEARADRGGRFMQGAKVAATSVGGKRISSVSLFIVAAVKDDTLITPRRIDFGEVVRGSGVVNRRLRIDHYGDEGAIFTGKRLEVSSPVLAACWSGEAERAIVDGNVCRLRRWVILSLDPSRIQTGAFSGTLDIRYCTDDKPLSFKVNCSAMGVDDIYSVPAAITRYGSKLSHEFNVDVYIRSRTGRNIIVDDIVMNQFELLNWTSDSDESMTSISLRLAPRLTAGRGRDEVIVNCRTPPGAVVKIPIFVTDFSLASY